MKVLSYTVLAGKLEDWETPEGFYQTERNIKVAHTYPTLEEALNIYEQCVGYHFNELTMTVEINGNKYDIDLYPTRDLMEATNRGEIK